MLFWVWSPNNHRPTRDIDLLGFGDNDKEYLEGMRITGHATLSCIF